MAELNLMRWGYLSCFLIIAGLLGYAYYLQHVEYLDPCPLCIFQRIAFMVMAAFFLVGGLHAPIKRFARVLYALLVSLAGAGGLAVAGRHVYLQRLPPELVPDCGPGLGYMMDTLPFSAVLDKVFTGSGECADVSWDFLGLTMPGWVLVWFAILIVAAWVFALVRRDRVSTTG